MHNNDRRYTEQDLDKVRKQLADIEKEYSENSENYKKWDRGELPAHWLREGKEKKTRLTRQIDEISREIARNITLNSPATEHEIISELWDDDQISVIRADPKSRYIVDAGPGTGKTAVACAKVAWMIKDHGIEPEKIHIISFTRAAVQEIRNRIRTYIANEGLNPEYANYVKIFTIDSYAYDQLRKGFDEIKSSGSYDENIQRAILMLDSNGGLRNHLNVGISHLIIDEAQDVVGIRSELLVNLLKSISKSCGVTVFSDDAQAIYEFSIGDQDCCYRPFMSRIRNDEVFSFSEDSLENVYRTQDEKMKLLFTDTRQKVLNTGGTIKEYRDLLKEIRQGKRVPKPIKSRDLNGCNNCFILFRYRVNVLDASHQRETKPHRIRLSKLPVCIDPWVGACFSEYEESRITRKDFQEFWEAIVLKNSLAEKDPDLMWAGLVHYAGADRRGKNIDLTMLREVLDTTHPPDIFCSPFIGDSGPILGTIHASKGRETDEVHLYLSKTPSEENIAEEIRVMYVGATRARKSLCIGNSVRLFPKYLNNDSRQFIKKSNTINVEVGREGDITAGSVVGRDIFSEEEAATVQNTLLSTGQSLVDARVSSNSSSDHYPIRIRKNDATAGTFSPAFKKDLDQIAGNSGYRLVDKAGIRIFGLRTIAFKKESPELRNLNEPYASSGFLLAPVIFGLLEIRLTDE